MLIIPKKINQKCTSTAKAYYIIVSGGNKMKQIWVQDWVVEDLTKLNMKVEDLIDFYEEEIRINENTKPLKQTRRELE
jgi:hypothetical protein